MVSEHEKKLWRKLHKKIKSKIYQTFKLKGKGKRLILLGGNTSL